MKKVITCLVILALVVVFINTFHTGVDGEMNKIWHFMHWYQCGFDVYGQLLIIIGFNSLDNWSWKMSNRCYQIMKLNLELKLNLFPIFM